MKKAIITGINGQDGSYLAESLLDKGYEVIGIARRKALPDMPNLENVINNDKLTIEYGSVTDCSFMFRTIDKYKPDEVYNLAANSFVANSFNNPIEVNDINMNGCLYCLEAIRQLSPDTKFYQASTSEMYGDVKETPQTENTPLNPNSPYGVSKVGAHFMCKVYRESYDIFATSGILFNHESPRRGIEFVTQKIVDGMVKNKCIELGNIEAKRDWGHAKDYVEAMWLMLQQNKPDDYVIAMNTTNTVKEFADKLYEKADNPLTWKGEGLNAVAIDSHGKTRITINEKYFRPNDVNYLRGDSSKARNELNWKPKYNLDTLIMDMYMNTILQNEHVCACKGEDSKCLKNI